jgi:2-dehydro-3-deoxyphosphogluconate aldolase / (4S)-4-hydroxy-2-oxoglutarate aldolase
MGVDKPSGACEIGSHMTEQSESAVFTALQAVGVVAVLIIENEEHAAPLAEALVAGGVTAMELTLRTPAAMGALRRIVAAVPEMTVGIGTILTPDQVREVKDAGAVFGVSPGLNPRVVETALQVGLPFAPGICTPSDIERALEYNRRLLKFFPCEPSGGLPYLNAIAAPYAHLGLRYVPLGGVSEANAATYLSNPHVGAIGGSWLAPQKELAAGNWGAITQAAQRVVAIRENVRSKTS